MGVFSGRSWTLTLRGHSSGAPGGSKSQISRYHDTASTNGGPSQVPFFDGFAVSFLTFRPLNEVVGPPNFPAHSGGPWRDGKWRPLVDRPFPSGVRETTVANAFIKWVGGIFIEKSQGPQIRHGDPWARPERHTESTSL